MILDKLTDSRKYDALSLAFAKAFSDLRLKDFHGVKDGRHPKDDTLLDDPADSFAGATVLQLGIGQFAVFFPMVK